MASPATLGAWARREAVLVSFLAAAAAIALLAGPLKAPWLVNAGATVAAAGALARVVIAVQRARLEHQLEQFKLAQRLRVKVLPISEVNPTLIGVDPAVQKILAGNAVPKYVDRAVDRELRKAIKAALDGSGSWLVVVEGPSKVGKSRTLFEALRESAPPRGLSFVAPIDADSLRSLLKPGEGVGRRLPGRAVLWLDDLEPFLNQGVTLQRLREWHAGGPGRIVAATYGGKGSELIAGSSAAGLTTLASDVLQHACEITLDATTASELSVLRSALTEQECEDVERHGLAAYLVAGPALERKLATGRHAPGEDACSEGVAVVNSAIDWARCGRTDPIKKETLRNLWPSYLKPGTRTTDEAFNGGLNWALRPAAGTVALLQETSSYKAYDYVVRLVRDKPNAEPPRAPFWTAAIETAADAQVYAVGVAAYQCSRLEEAIDAFARARASSVDEVAAGAGVGLGFVLGELLGRFEEAIEVSDQVVARFGDAPEPAVRERVAMALVGKGLVMGKLGRFEQAIEVSDQVVARFGDAPEPAVRERVARALVGKGLAMGKLGRFEQEIEVFDQVVARFGDTPEPGVREQVAGALYKKSFRLRELGRFEQAIGASDQVVARFGDAPEPAVRERVAMALVFKGSSLEELGRFEEAIEVSDQVVARFGDAPEPAVRERVAMALVGKGLVMGKLGRFEQAIEVYDQVVARFGDTPEPGVREQVATALVNKGATLGILGRSEQAIEVYDQVAVRFGDTPEPGVREWVAMALVFKGSSLGERGRSEQAIEVYDQVVARFGDTPEPGVREQVATALVNKGVALGILGRSEQAIEVYDQMVARFGDIPEPGVREAVAQAVTARQQTRGTE